MSEETRALLAALLEALDIPSPATVGDAKVHDRILNDRVMHARIAIEGALDDERSSSLGIEWTTSYLRERLAEHPPTGYRAWGQPQAEADGGES